ncbi:protein phosphatase 2C domain-containing protein [Alphaproteobacteria bacterium]|nr:protein phosphatase 2C domain-containing protein [Alphaproteobacteria bacterium]
MWKTGSISVHGIAHIDAAQINQDLVLVESMGDAHVIIVCDGAGSAPHSKLGAEIVCGEVFQAILNNPESVIESPAKHQEDMLKSVKTGIDLARQKILQGKAVPRTSLELFFESFVGVFSKHLPKKIEVPPPPLNHFAATVLIAVFTEDQLFYSHIGDGFICGLKITNSQEEITWFQNENGPKPAQQSYSNAETLSEWNIEQTVTSLPENGEYANQTYFFTDENWRDHLRAGACVEKINFLALMTDGAIPFLIEKNQKDFVLKHAEKIIKLSVSYPDMGISELLTKMFTKEKVHSLTSDDTTIGLAVQWP